MNLYINNNCFFSYKLVPFSCISFCLRESWTAGEEKIQVQLSQCLQLFVTPYSSKYPPIINDEHDHRFAATLMSSLKFKI